MRAHILFPVVLVLLVAGLLGCGAAASSTGQFTTSLTRAQEVPKPTHVSAAAGGSFHGTVSGHVLVWTLSFSGLTGPVTATYLHFGAEGQTGTVLAALCAPCEGSPSHGSTKLSAAAIRDVRAGMTYVNVDTFKNPRGEIRGQLG